MGLLSLLQFSRNVKRNSSFHAGHNKLGAREVLSVTIPLCFGGNFFDDKDSDVIRSVRQNST